MNKNSKSWTNDRKITKEEMEKNLDSYKRTIFMDEDFTEMLIDIEKDKEK